MIKQTIENMKHQLLRDKEELDVKQLFDSIINHFKINLEMINQYSKFETGEVYDIKFFERIFVKDIKNLYGNLDKPYLNDYGRVSHNFAPKGVVGVKIAKKIMLENYLELIKVCLETRNAIIIEQQTNSKLLELLVVLINDIVKQTTDYVCVELTNVALENQDIDVLVYVGKKSEFEKLSTSAEKIYVGVGEYELFVDEPMDVNLIEKAKSLGVVVFEKQKGDTIEKLNSLGANYACAIMSPNKSEIKKFISQAKASNILVNMLPTLVTKINLNPEQLVKRKSVVIYQ